MKVSKSKNLSNATIERKRDWRGMSELFDSFRDSPKVPAEWRSKTQPGATARVPIRNISLKKFLRTLLPGKWSKVYHYGVDGSEVHYCRHESGKVFDVEYHRAP